MAGWGGLLTDDEGTIIETVGGCLQGSWLTSSKGEILAVKEALERLLPLIPKGSTVALRLDLQPLIIQIDRRFPRIRQGRRKRQGDFADREQLNMLEEAIRRAEDNGCTVIAEKADSHGDDALHNLAHDRAREWAEAAMQRAEEGSEGSEP